MKLRSVIVLLVVGVELCAQWWTAHAIEDSEIRQEGGSGSAVVLLSVARIQQSGRFADDNELLRRIAHVETRDGTAEDTYREGFDGGVWAVSREAFLDTQDTNANQRLRGRFEDIQNEFQIDWPSVTWRDLRKPLYSAIAARLVLFVAPASIPQTSDIPAQAEFWMQYYNPGGSTANFIAAASELEGNILESAANEFFLGFTVNAGAPASLLLFVTTPEPNPVRFDVETLTGFSFSGTATNNATTRVTLPIDLQVASDSILERDKGIRVRAEEGRRIVVYGLNFHQFSSDAFVALPCDRLPVDEYEYYAISYTPLQTSTPSTVLLVGCEDNTTITTPSSIFILNQLETFVIANTSDDLTGTRIASNKPISVFSGSVCSNVPIGVTACDHLTEQVPPTAIWGRFFLTASFLGRTSGEIIRILASTGATEVVMNCTTESQPSSFTLSNAGSWVEVRISTDSFCSIESSNSILVFEFGLGNELDNVGDPFMTMIPPVEQYGNNYVFSVLPDFSTNFITVHVAPEFFQSDRIFVDDMSLETASWTEVYCTGSVICGFITRVPLQPGEHRLFHQDANANIGLIAYGFNEFNSYGYPGGLQLIPIQLAVVSFSEVSYSIEENDLELKVSIVRSGNTERLTVVLVASENFIGTASARSDYVPVTQILEFQSGETEKEITVTIVNDAVIEEAENFELYLTGSAGIHLSPFPRAVVTIVNDDGIIFLDPQYGSMIGGAPIIVSGPRFLIQEDDQITCEFNSIQVDGIYINPDQALCVSPPLSQSGRVPFQITVTGRTVGQSLFISLNFLDSYEVYIDNEDLLFSEGTSIGVHWSPLSILPVVNPDDYSVDIILTELFDGSWRELAILGSDLPNTGFAQLTVPSIAEDDTLSGSITPIMIQVSVSSRSTEKNNLPVKRDVSNILRNLGKFALRTIKNTPIRFLKKLVRQAGQRLLCELWSSFQPDGIGEAALDMLPPCPRTVAAANAPNSGFVEERVSSKLPFIGTIQNYFGTTIVDDKFREFFHPGTSNCFRQRVTMSSQTGGAGQQCCYNSRGNLVIGPPGGGTVDIVSPDISYIRHFANDVLPFLLCCKAGIFSDCDEYYKHRPSGRAREPPPPPACVYGDPHIVTLDGHKYTFNGKGEFTLIETPDNSFTLQARMVEISDANGTSTSATVFSAIAVKQDDSDTVQFEFSNGTLTAFVNGETVSFDVLVEQQFNNVTVSVLDTGALSASLSSGAYVEVREENEIISVLLVGLPRDFQNIQTFGLMGSFNGIMSDDLLPRQVLNPLPLDSSLQEIHELFGLTWIIDAPTDSLFSYQPGESWATYYDPFFVPFYEPVFASPDLEAQANELCGDDTFCLFDIAATGRVEIGLSTLEGGQEFELILELSIPVVCDPPCENGACVANDTCNCAAGFEGERCTEPVFTECDESPCQNGGSCTRHVLDYICNCPPEHTGSFCENGGSNPVIIGATVGSIVAVIVLAGVAAVVIAVLVSRNSKAKVQVKAPGDSVVIQNQLKIPESL